jgi:hypothetical protein
MNNDLLNSIELSLVYKIDPADEELFIEKVNAIKIDNGDGISNLYQVVSIPAFAKNIAYGDIVKVELENGEYHFEELVKESGHSVVHIVILNADSRQKIISILNNHHCEVNTTVGDNYLVVDIPPLVSYTGIKKILDSEKMNKNIDFSESTLSQHHSFRNS